ncbi:MAG: looped-hinge helix binding domain, AbrB family [Acidobacteriaceae bacterium]|nr:looped-hinge helix binding domain, AbrB family [Acidobacteriaceae bacterium]
MKIASKVGERGQVVIPKAFRDNLGLDKNTAVEFEMKGTTLTLTPKRDRHDFDLAMKRYRGSLREQFLAEGNTTVAEYIKEIRGR